MTERRTMPRYNVALPITVGEVRGTTSNLGVNGVSFVAPSPMRVDESVDVSIALSRDPNALTINCKGVVKRATRLKDGQFEIALAIDALGLATGS